MIDKSRLTIQRPEGCPEWAEIGVWVMVRQEPSDEWDGPYPLEGFDSADQTFWAGYDWWLKAKPYIKWQPELGEYVAFWDGDSFDVSIRQYKCELAQSRFGIFGDHYGTVWEHCARLVDDDGNLIDLRCSVEELKERTVWL